MTDTQQQVLNLLRFRKSVTPLLLQRKMGLSYAESFKLCEWLATVPGERIVCEKENDKITIRRK